jgi:hypothetical protein
VRAAAVYDLGADDAEALLALAREDGEVRVRRAAVTRVDDLAVLAEIARTDPEDEVRHEAIRGLAGLAAEAEAPGLAADAVRHLIALGRLKEVVVVARSNPSLEVRAAVVDLLDDPKSLGAVSRHAQDGQTRLRALGRVRDAAELLNVALKADHTDAAVAALDRIDDAESLATVAQRGRNKVAARRARTRLRQAEEATGSAAPAPMAAGDRERALDLVRRAEAVVAVGSPDEASSELAAVRLAWAELQADAEVEASLAQQFDAASDAAREAVDERRREHEAEQERQQALAREQADRMAIVAEIEGLDGPLAADRIAELRARWDSLPPMPSEYAASLTRRFQDVSRAFEERERRRVLAEAAATRLDALAGELEHLLALAQPVEDTVSRWRALRRDAELLREHADANQAAAARLEAAIAALEAKETELQEARGRQEQDNLRRVQQLCRQVEALLSAEQFTLKAGERALRETRAALDERAPLPTRQDRQDVQARLQAARDALGPRVQELRAADEWQRWANLQVQEELCREMEALQAEEHLERASRRMRDLQSRWKQVALAPRAQGEAMWRRFKAAQDQVYTRTATFAAAQREERGTNLARKLALCEQVEALADSTDWVKTATAIQALQAEWKSVGPVSRGHEKAVWERFRGACDRFFTRRQEDLTQRKDTWSANLARKEELCAAAEALADSSDWDQAVARLKQLQAEWKQVGPVRRTKSEVVWQRFRAACDRFFERYKHRDQVDLQAKAAAREAVIRDLEALAPAEGGAVPDAPGDLHETLQQARARWQQAPELPRTIQQELAARYHQAMAHLVTVWPAAFAGTELDPEATRKRMEKIVARVEQLVAEHDAPRMSLSPTERLAQQLRERLAANTMSTGRSGETEGARLRRIEEEMRAAQTQWMRLGPVPAEVAGPLNERFQRACRKLSDVRRRAS